jgi:hypothetical protein
VWDLRLKKAVETRLTNDEMASSSLSEQVLQLRDSLAAQAPELNDIFVPRRAPRPAIPLYIANLDRDRKELLASMKNRRHGQASYVAEMEQLFSERLKRQAAIAEQRAERRKRKQAELERETKEFLGRLHQTKHPEDVDLKQTAKAQEQKAIEKADAKAELAKNLRIAEKKVLKKIENSPRKPLRWNPSVNE